MAVSIEANLVSILFNRLSTASTLRSTFLARPSVLMIPESFQKRDKLCSQFFRPSLALVSEQRAIERLKTKDVESAERLARTTGEGF
jgi:hypothetical protein